MTTEFSKMDDEAQADVIDAVLEQAAANDDDETTAKLLTAANQLIDDSEKE